MACEEPFKADIQRSHCAHLLNDLLPLLCAHSGCWPPAGHLKTSVLTRLCKAKSFGLRRIGFLKSSACRTFWGMGQRPMKRSATAVSSLQTPQMLAALAWHSQSEAHAACPEKPKIQFSLVTYSRAVWHLFRGHRASVARLRLPSASLTPPAVKNTSL